MYYLPSGAVLVDEQIDEAKRHELVQANYNLKINVDIDPIPEGTAQDCFFISSYTKFGAYNIISLVFYLLTGIQSLH